MVGQPPAPCPGRTCGDVGAPAPSPLPRQPAGTWRGTSSPGRRGGERGAAAWTPAKRRPRPGVDPGASHARQPSTIPVPPGPMRAATTKPLTDHRDPVEPAAPAVAGPGRTDGFRVQRGADSAAAAAADTGRVSVRTPGSHRSCGHRTPWTPVAWTPDVHPTSWTEVRPHGGQRRWTAQPTAWPASRHPGRPRRRRPPGWAANARSGCRACGARQPHNGSAVTTPTAAVTGAAPQHHPT
jgi:hypothetical protein